MSNQAIIHMKCPPHNHKNFVQMMREGKMALLDHEMLLRVATEAGLLDVRDPFSLFPVPALTLLPSSDRRAAGKVEKP